jgi:hypothetical protein
VTAKKLWVGEVAQLLSAGNTATPGVVGRSRTPSRIVIRVFQKTFTTLKAYINSFRRHVQCFETSKCSKTHRALPGIVTAQRDFHW